MIDEFLDDSLPEEIKTQFSKALDNLHHHFCTVARESLPQTGKVKAVPSLTDLFSNLNLNPCIQFMSQIYELLRIVVSSRDAKSENELLNLKHSLTALNLGAPDQAQFFLNRPKALSFLIYGVLISQNNQPIIDILKHAQAFEHYEQLRWLAGFYLKLDVPLTDNPYHQQFLLPFKEAKQLPVLEPKQNVPSPLIHPIDVLFSICQIDQALQERIPDPAYIKRLPREDQLLEAIFQLQGGISLLIILTKRDEWDPIYDRMNAGTLGLYQTKIELNGCTRSLAIAFPDYTEQLVNIGIYHMLKCPNRIDCIKAVAQYLMLYTPKSHVAFASLHTELAPITQLFLTHGLYDEAFQLSNEISFLYADTFGYMHPGAISKASWDTASLRKKLKVQLKQEEINWYSFYLEILERLVNQKLTIEKALEHPNLSGTYAAYNALKTKTPTTLIADLAKKNLKKIASMAKDDLTRIMVNRFYEYIKPALPDKDCKELDAKFPSLDEFLRDSKPKKKTVVLAKKPKANPKNPPKPDSGKKALNKPQNPSLASPKGPAIPLPSSSSEISEKESAEFTLVLPKVKTKKIPSLDMKTSQPVKNNSIVIKKQAILPKASRDDSLRFFPKSKNKSPKKVNDSPAVTLPNELIEFIRPFLNSWTPFYLTGAAVYELSINKEPCDYDVLAIGASLDILYKKAEQLGLNPQRQGKKHPILKMTLASGKEVEISCVQSPPIDAKAVLLADYKTRDFKNSAMYVSISEEKRQSIIDFDGSLHCCRQGVLQTVTHPLTCWQEDTLRVLRLIKWKLKFPELQFSKEIQDTLNDPQISFLNMFQNHQRSEHSFRGRFRTSLDTLFKRFGIEAVNSAFIEYGILPSLLECSQASLKLNQKVIEFHLQQTHAEAPTLRWLIALNNYLRNEGINSSNLPSLIYLNPNESQQLKASTHPRTHFSPC